MDLPPKLLVISEYRTIGELGIRDHSSAFELLSGVSNRELSSGQRGDVMGHPVQGPPEPWPCILSAALQHEQQLVVKVPWEFDGASQARANCLPLRAEQQRQQSHDSTSNLQLLLVHVRVLCESNSLGQWSRSFSIENPRALNLSENKQQPLLCQAGPRSAAAAPSPVLGNIPPNDGMPGGPIPPGFFQPGRGWEVLPWSAISLGLQSCEKGFPGGAPGCDIASFFKPVLPEFEQCLVVHTF
ncbi:hypothetical protein A6R68_06557 [Neotoma lepida]|uniref:Uncharacterized protein n=1 Tax=Neotoma lepida TaxID=56216 RepID=A0A1A6GF98_NEOLE|nr:hypothetical protein A6R68_06557 [Neotoma lepida]